MGESSDTLIWIDAGTVLTGGLQRIRSVIASRGIFAHRASGPAQLWTHPLTFSAMGAGAGEFHRDQLAAGFVGVNLRSALGRNVISRWAMLARDQQVIAPPGSSRANHRQDQAVFSLVMYQTFSPVVPNVLLSFIGFWPGSVKQYLTNQDV
jgi:hypothetical protein